SVISTPPTPTVEILFHEQFIWPQGGPTFRTRGPNAAQRGTFAPLKGRRLARSVPSLSVGQRLPIEPALRLDVEKTSPQRVERRMPVPLRGGAQQVHHLDPPGALPALLGRAARACLGRPARRDERHACHHRLPTRPPRHLPRHVAAHLD